MRMLRLEVPLTPEEWDPETEMFIEPKVQVLQLEHSLVSLSKWESKWCKPFLPKDIKTREETADYVRCMTMTQNVDPIVYTKLTNENIEQVNKYIDAPMTATWFGDDKSKRKSGKGSSKATTSELIYFWMISLNIPFECQKWHLNRLLTLINVCNEENKPHKKKSTRETISNQAALNAARKKKLNTKG